MLLGSAYESVGLPSSKSRIRGTIMKYVQCGYSRREHDHGQMCSLGGFFQPDPNHTIACDDTGETFVVWSLGYRGYESESVYVSTSFDDCVKEIKRRIT